MGRFLVCFFLIVTVLTFFPSQSQALVTTFDFEGLAPTFVDTGSNSRTGALPSLSITQDGLTIDIFRESGSRFDTVDNTVVFQSGKTGFGNVSLDPFFDLSGTAFIVEFSQPVSLVSVEMGDYDAFDDAGQPIFEDDAVTIEVFDEDGNFIASLSNLLEDTGTLFNFNSINVGTIGAPEKIAFLRMIGGDPDIGNNSVFYDNLTVEFEVLPFPEPATILLIGAGIVGLAGFRRKFKR